MARTRTARAAHIGGYGRLAWVALPLALIAGMTCRGKLWAAADLLETLPQVSFAGPDVRLAIIPAAR